MRRLEDQDIENNDGSYSMSFRWANLDAMADKLHHTIWIHH